MRAKKELPQGLVRAVSRFAAWRRKNVPHTRIPRFLWSAAVKLAAEFGVSRTASVLRLNYLDLKKHLESKFSPSERVSRTGRNPFVELPATALPASCECVIELENSTGSKMRIQLKGSSYPDLIELSDTFLNNR